MSLGSGGLEQRLILDKVIFTSDPNQDPNKLPVKEIFVSKDTGQLVIVYEDGEE